MLDEWDKDNKLALLEPAVEGTGSTSASFVHSTLVAVLVERLSVWCTEEDEPPVKRWRVDEQILIWAPLPDNVGRRLGSEG